VSHYSSPPSTATETPSSGMASASASV
jgi:hypothetical protein